MQIVELTQGSPEWHAHRANHFNASDAPAMMGVSKYKTRSELLREIHTGLTAEIDAGTQRRFDDGHRFEALARPLAETIIGEDLYPAVGVEGKYSASFDGLTMDESIAFEHKMLNNDIRDAINAGAPLPDQYRVQMEQQLMISGASKCLFMATSWTNEDQLVEEMHCWYEPDLDLRAKIVAGWDQFASDLANYQHVEQAAAPVAAPIADLPALSVELVGRVTSSNLNEWQHVVVTRIKQINTNLQTDQDFADAEKTVKFLADGEKKLEIVKEQALAQTASIDELFRAIDGIKEEMRAKRLELNRTVEKRKTDIRAEIEARGRKALAEHIEALNQQIGKPYMPKANADFAGKMKGKKTVASLNDAVDTELARAKAEANEIADRIQINLATMAEKCDANLFPDIAMVCTKAPEDFSNLVAIRIAQQKEREALAAEKARQEAEAKAAEKARADAMNTNPLAQVAAIAPAASAAEVVSGSATLNPSASKSSDWIRMRDLIDDQLRTMNIPELQQVLDAIRAIRARRAA